MPRRTAALAALAITAASVWGWATFDRAAASGFVLRLAPRAGGAARIVRTFDLDPIRARRLSPSVPASARWSGWITTGAGPLDVIVATRSPTRVLVDGAVVVDHDGRPRRLTGPVHVSAGTHEIAVEHELGAEESDLRVAIAASGGEPQRLDGWPVFHTPPTRAHRVRPWAGLAALFSTLALLALFFPRVRAATAERRAALARGAACAAAALITLYGAALRIEALASKYDAPAWMSTLVPIVRDLHPRGMKWLPPEHPYQGDPFSYLRLAREMRTFYAASIREPLFVFTTRIALAVADNRDVAVSLASAFFSVLLVPATYVLGAAAFSPGVGLIAAAAMAVERQAIGHGVDGWRDDAFALFVVLSAAALLRLRQRPTWFASTLAGLAMGAALLTRITSLSFIVPALAVVALTGEAPPRARLRHASAAAALAALLLAPFLVACALEYGDPLHSINAHTRFYRSRAAGTHEAATGWPTMLAERGGPFTLLDTGLVGLTAYPFTNKWEHFDYLGPWIGPVLATAAVAGLLLWMFVPPGRLLLLILFSSLLPFAFTWDVPGGSEWRFTLHAYPFYLVAMASVPWLAARVARRLRWRWVAAAAGGTVALYLALCGLVYARVHEEVHGGRSARIGVGRRDLFFFGKGWSRPTRLGHALVREGDPTGAELRVPLRPGRPYRLVLRVDPAGPTARAALTLNGSALGEIDLVRDERRMGRYEVDIPPTAARDRTDTLRIQASAPFRLWLVHIEPR